MSTRAWAGEIVGREAELERVAHLVDADDGLPRGVVLAGEPGIGKTHLWERGLALARERGLRTLVARPAGTEIQLSWATLASLLEDGLADVLEVLPAPQRRALEAALLLDDPDGEAVDTHAVLRAFSTALRALATEPLLLAIDDAQWIDQPSAEALVFALRRVDGLPIRVFATVRAGVSDVELDLERIRPGQVERIDLHGLGLADMSKLLTSRFGDSLPDRLVVRIHDLSGGNPFFAQEIARALLREPTLPRWNDPLPLPSSLDELVQRRIAELRPRVRATVCAAAALTKPTTTVLAAVCGDAGRVETDLAAAAEAGVFSVAGEEIHFTHPLLASAAYAGMSSRQRRDLHLRIADVVGDSEERARHLAQVPLGPDEKIAALLESSAVRLRERGAARAAAELLERAVELTPRDAPALLRRRIRLAEALTDLLSDRARPLLEALIAELPPGPDRALLLTKLSDCTFELGRMESLGLQALAEANGDVHVLAEIYHRLAYVPLRDRGDLAGTREHADAFLAAAERAGDPDALSRALITSAYVEFISGGGLRRDLCERATALCGVRSDEWRTFSLGRLSQTHFARMLIRVGELDEARPLLEEIHAHARQHDDDFVVSTTLLHLADLEYCAGKWECAASYAIESYERAVRLENKDTRSALCQWAELGAATQSRTAARKVLEAVRPRLGTGLFDDVGFVSDAGFVAWSLGDFARAHQLLERAARECFETDMREPSIALALPYAPEVAVAAGDLTAAQDQIDHFDALSHPLERWRALLATARARALLEDARRGAEAALAAVEEAFGYYARLPSPHPWELGRIHHVKGVVQRHAGSKAAARESLLKAVEIYAALPAPLWVEQAEAELARIGGRRAPSGRELSGTESQIVDLVVDGRSNKEIAQRLSLSPKTVEWNLSKVYRKLGVRSRAELGAKRRERQTA